MESIHPLIIFCIERGVPRDTVGYLLLLPIIVTVVTFFRQVVGIKAFGIYASTIIALVFLGIGLKYGIALFFIVIAVGMSIRIILKKLRILYLPRVAITVSIVAFIVLAALVLSGSFQRTGLAAVSIFPLLIIVTLVEKFVAAQTEHGTRIAIFLALETLLISIVVFLLAHSWLLSLIIQYPLVVLLTIPLNVVLGKWTGLRLVEYIRFREVLKRIS